MKSTAHKQIRQKCRVNNNVVIKTQREPQTQNNHIVQLKDELVKMKKFLNDELPQITKIIPFSHDYLNNGNQAFKTQISQAKIKQICTANQKLKQKNRRLEAELSRQKSLKKQLSRSLKKHEHILNNLHVSTHKYTESRQGILNSPHFQHNRSLKSLGFKPLQKQLFPRSHSKKSQQFKQDQFQKINVKRQILIQKVNEQKFETQTSILKNLQKSKKGESAVKETAPCYSSSQQQMISSLRQVAQLEKKLQSLMRQSHKTQNRVKKLQIRSQMQKISNKLHILKQSLGKSV